MKSQCQFEVGGQRCVGTLYRPNRAGPLPCVVFAGGLGVVRDMRMDSYGAAFNRAGYAMFAFDYRHWGDSEGTPRELCKPSRQIADIHAAIDYVKQRSDIDAKAITLFGSSFGGGHALLVASQRQDLEAVVIQCAAVDGLALAADVRPLQALKLALLGVADVVSRLVLRRPVYVKVVGKPGSAAMITAPGALEGYLALTDPGTRFRNRVNAGFFFAAPFHRPIKAAGRIKSRLLSIVCDKDDICAPRLQAKAATLAQRGISSHFPVDHFQIYVGLPFKRAVADVVEFLHWPEGWDAPQQAVNGRDVSR